MPKGLYNTVMNICSPKFSIARSCSLSTSVQGSVLGILHLALPGIRMVIRRLHMEAFGQLKGPFGHCTSLLSNLACESIVLKL
eukprot:jgi/Botrbrau1/7632/Bobra.0159s0080.1